MENSEILQALRYNENSVFIKIYYTKLQQEVIFFRNAIYWQELGIYIFQNLLNNTE